MAGLLAAGIVVVTGLYFVGLAAVSLSAPGVATRFLLGHAGSAFAHYLELLLRLAAGTAFLLHAPSMRFPAVFDALGRVLVATTLVLCAVPWRWHQRFAQRSVPHAVRYLKLIAIASFVLGVFVLTAAALGTT